MKFFIVVCLSILATCECFPGSMIPFAIPVKRSYEGESAYQLPSPHADQLHQALRTVKSRSQQDINGQNSHPVDLLWVPLPKNGKQHHKSPLLPIPISKEMSDSKSPFKIVIVNSDAHDKDSRSLSLDGIERLLEQLEPITQNVDDLPVQQHHVKIQHVNREEPKFHVQLPPEPFRETAAAMFRTNHAGRDGEVKMENGYSKVQKNFVKHTEHKQKAVYPAEEMPFQTNGYSGQNGANGNRESQQSNGDYGNHKATSGYWKQQKVSQYNEHHEKEQSNGGYNNQKAVSGYGAQQKGNQYSENRPKEHSNGGYNNQKTTLGYGEEQKGNQYSENRPKEHSNGGYNNQKPTLEYGEQQNGNQYSENRPKEHSNGGYNNQKATSGYGEQQKESQYGEIRQREQSNNGYNNQNGASGYEEQQIGSQYNEQHKKEETKATSNYGEHHESNSYSETSTAEQSGRSYGGKAVTKQNGAGSYVHVEVNSYGGHPHLATEGYSEAPKKYGSKESTVGQNNGAYGMRFQQNGASFGKPKPFGKAEVHVTVVDDHEQQQAEEKNTQYVQSSSYAPLESANDEFDVGYQSSPPSIAFGGYGGPEQDVHYEDPIRELVPILPGILQTMQSYSNQEHSQTVHEGPEYGSSTPYPPIHMESTSSSYGPPSFQEAYSHYSQSPSSSGYDHTQSSLGYGSDHLQSSSGYEEQSLSTSGYESNSDYGHSHSGHEELQSSSSYGHSTETNSGYKQSHSGNGNSYSSNGNSYSGNGNSYSGNGNSYFGNGNSHSENGNSHSSNGNSHSSNGNSHSSNGNSHSSNGNSHSSNGNSHSSNGNSHSSNGNSHSSNGNSHFDNGHSHNGGSQSQSNSGYGHSAELNSGYGHSAELNSGYGHSHTINGEIHSNSGYGHSHSSNGESHSNSGYGHSHSGNGESHSNSGYGQSKSNSGHYPKPPKPAYPKEEPIESSQKPPCKHADVYVARPPISVPEMHSEGPRPMSAAFDKYQGGVQVAPPPPVYPRPIESEPSYRSREEQNYGGALEPAANTVQETYTENKTNGKPFYIVIFQKRKVAKPTY